MDYCESCGIKWVDHLGIIGMWKKLMEAQADNKHLLDIVTELGTMDCNNISVVACSKLVLKAKALIKGKGE